ncbi:glycosyltransferase [Streptomyces phage WheeHeim]|uniref:Glycosyltransferase n=1 Tax=Streptomyces phage WheeHeim TaxID=2500797 RepID=A0A411AXW6_9VIRU|nr:glycosyltransferase [Streptomyces phage WheeHeim]QAX92934.1 glycosyltransferase [Streptomyces phage WheeHeim]
MALSDAQIAGAAKAAGFSGSALAKAVAIALAESSGNPNAHNAVPPDNSYGLWQINMLGSMGPARRKQFGLKSNDDLFNPTTNAKAAYAISNGGKNFGPWSTYTSGAYLRYMSRANKAAGNPDSSVPGSSNGGVEQAGLTDVFSWPGEIMDFFEFITDPNTWLRAGMLIGGAVLVGVALVQISGAGSQIGQVANAAVDFVPGGGAIKKAAKAGSAAKAAKAVS